MKYDKKIILSVLIMVTCLTIIPGRTGKARENHSENLLRNPDFEVLEESGKPKFWSRGGGWSVDTEEPYQGKNCLRASKAWSWLLQEVSAKPEKYYSFTACIKSDIRVERKTDYQNTFLWLDYLDKEGKIIKEDSGAIYAVSSWRPYGRVILTPTKTKKIRVKLGKRLGEGSVWFDGIELRPLSNNLLLNPDFEILDSQGRPVFWSIGCGWSVDTMMPYRGKNCMQGTEPWHQLWQLLPARAESFFILKTHLRSNITAEGADNLTTIVLLKCLDSKGKLIRQEERAMLVPFSWQEREISVYTPEDTTAVKIVLAKRLGKGNLWVDDLQVRQLPSYLRIRIIRAILEDKPFFIFYFSLYLILIISLIRVVLKR
jgi:hypothetical protein